MIFSTQIQPLLPRYEPVGCFSDKNGPRALPKFIQNYSVNETDLANSFTAIIHTCATKVYERGFWYFGVEYRYQCWSGVNGSLTHSIHGASDKCLSNYGVGSFWTIFVYRRESVLRQELFTFLPSYSFRFHRH